MTNPIEADPNRGSTGVYRQIGAQTVANISQREILPPTAMTNPIEADPNRGSTGVYRQIGAQTVANISGVARVVAGDHLMQQRGVQDGARTRAALIQRGRAGHQPSGVARVVAGDHLMQQRGVQDGARTRAALIQRGRVITARTWWRCCFTSTHCPTPVRWRSVDGDEGFHDLHRALITARTWWRCCFTSTHCPTPVRWRSVDGDEGFHATAWPFLTGTGIGWVLARGWRRRPPSAPTGVIVWLCTIVYGMAISHRHWYRLGAGSRLAAPTALRPHGGDRVVTTSGVT